MPIDPSIALQTKGIQLDNPLDTATKVLSLRDLAMKSQAQNYQMQQAMQDRQDRAASVTTDANGNPQFDSNKYQMLASQHQPQNFQQIQTDQNQMSLEQHKQHVDMRQAALQGYDGSDASWDNTRNTMKAQGLDVSMLPEQNPGQSFVDTATQHLLGAEKNIAIQQKNSEIANTAYANKLKAAELGATLKKDFGSAIPSSAGQPTAGGGLSPQDPSDLVQNLPQHLQSKALEEIKAAQNTAQNAPKILQAFDNAANNLHAADFVPGVHNADQKALHALMGPTFQDVEGTVRQAAMDNMNENTTPQFGDSAETLKTKRAALVGYLESKKSAPTAKAGGIDLSKFASTSPDTSGPKNEDPVKVAQQHPLQDLVAERAARQKTRSASNNNPNGNNN